MSGEETLSQAPSQPPPPTSGLPNQLGAGPNAREPLQAGEVPIRPPARSRSAAGRFPTPQGPAPNVRHPPLRGAEAPASQPAPSHRALTCAGPRVRLRLWAAGLNPLSLGWSSRLSSTWGGLCPAPADPAAGPAPARPSPVLIGSCSHPSPLGPPLDPPPAPPEDLPAGNRPGSSPVWGPEPCPGAWAPRGCGCGRQAAGTAVVRPRPLDKAP